MYTIWKECFDLFGLETADLLEGLVKLMIIFMILPLHEFAHAWTANKLGDYTAKYKGRLTLSPFAHIDIMGAILLFFCGFGWAKPVPVNPMHFKRPRYGMMLTSLAGPLSNLAAALVGTVILQVMSGVVTEVTETIMYVVIMLNAFIAINVNLALFNLIPVPPLDGSAILGYFLPRKVDYWIQQNQMTFYVIVLVLMVTGILSTPLMWLSGKICEGLVLITDWIPMLIG